MQIALKNSTECLKTTIPTTATSADIDSQCGNMSTTAAAQATSPYHQQEIRQPNRSSLLNMGGVAVFPTSLTNNTITERRTLRSIGDSSQDLNSNGNESVSIVAITSTSESRNSRLNGNASSNEMSDSQRSLSEDRLVDSYFNREQFSRSHDSVFSESATASSISLVKAELADVLRKRRQRPDASEEDLGLPRSPTSPQRRIHNAQTITSTNINTSSLPSNQSERSSLSLLSVNSADEDFLITSTTNNSTNTSGSTTASSQRYVRSSTSTTSITTLSTHSSKQISVSKSKDEVDLRLKTSTQKLSHSAAKHKMAVKPAKQRRPTMPNRRTLEISIPEANEGNNGKTFNKSLSNTQDKEQKSKSQTNPPSVSVSVNVTKTNTSSYTTANQTKTAANKTTDLTDKKQQLEQPTHAKSTSNVKEQNLDENNKKSNNSSASTSSTSLFGLRGLTARAATTLIDGVATPTISQENLMQKSQVIASSSSVTETSDSGFLRRIVTRNSKRKTIDLKNEQEEQHDYSAKKLHVSNSDMCMKPNNTLTDDVPKLDKCRSAMSHHQSVEEKRKEIKKEIMSEGAVGISAMFNSFISGKESIKSTNSTSGAQQSKPKSGPAARQRILPQEIDVAAIDHADMSAIKSLDKSVVLQQEMFESSSSVCNIKPLGLSKAQHDRVEHHFEKKPKIVGLSAFQQKISRSHDTVNYSITSDSNDSLETMSTFAANSLSYDYTQKKRNSVEKSRSFRTYNEQRDEVENNSGKEQHISNMPSLPDLSLNLRVPFYAENANNSLGFEINDNNLLSSQKKSSSCQTHATSNAGLANVVMPELTGSKRCNQDIREIEQNIDKIVKSTVVNVFSGNGTTATVLQSPTKVSSANKQLELDDCLEQDRNLSDYEHVPRPKSLLLKEQQVLDTSNTLISPTLTKVSLRDKSKTLAETTAKVTSTVKPTERKSAPNGEAIKINLYKTARRSSSVVESSTDPPETDVPEFMKIQLNRVNASCKANIVLAKNIKQTKESKQSKDLKQTKECKETEKLTKSIDLRRCSNESLDINEKEVITETKQPSKQTTKIANKTLQPDNNCALPPKAPISAKRNSLTSQTSKVPTTPTEKTPVVSKIASAVAETVIAGNKTETTTIATLASTSNSKEKNTLSLQERRKLFMQDQALMRSESNWEEARLERKKSLPKVEPTKLNVEKTTEAVNGNKPEASATSGEGSVVMLRKKSFAGNGNAVSLNNNNKDDATPELIKVFARRSLKIRDEDLTSLSDKIMTNSWHNNNNNNVATTLQHQQHQQQQQNVDSDKENHSVSDEQLNKLPKNDAATMPSVEHVHGVTKLTTQANGQSNVQRSSLTDLRKGVSNNNSSNNNHNCNGKTHLLGNKLLSNRLSVEPTATDNNNTNKKSILERQSLSIKTSNESMQAINHVRSIERSATVGEFKGIHQRRAEWEQRAKEAFK